MLGFSGDKKEGREGGRVGKRREGRKEGRDGWREGERDGAGLAIGGGSSRVLQVWFCATILVLPLYARSPSLVLQPPKGPY